MTREEAIEVLENGEWWEELTEWYMVVHPEHNKLHDAVDMAISALRQQEHFREVTKKVEPLTLDELREMDGEPVWTENNTVHGKFYAWSLVDAKREQVRNANGFVKYFSMYGKEWIAYRQKPEEGTV